jgi:hypothetical protein
MFAKSREQPSVVSTRILKTHRLNEVETFRLQGKIRTIDNEIHNNYCQISDEIDGVRKNLNRIKKLKNNLSISVERRKLLREKGVFVIPSPGFGDEGITLRRTDGRKVMIRGKECYDGEIIRRFLDTSSEFAQLNVEGDAEEEESSDSGRGDEENHAKKNVFQYRIISPPLRPGSRRNFKDVEEDEQSNVEMDLPPSENYMDSLRKSPYRVRAQTTTTRREGRTRQQNRQRQPRQGRVSNSTLLDVEDLENYQTIENHQEQELGEQELGEPFEMPSSQKQQELHPENSPTDVYKTKERKLQFKSDTEGLNYENKSKVPKGKVRRNSNTTLIDKNPAIAVIDVDDVNKGPEKDLRKIARKTSAMYFSSERAPVIHQRKMSLSAEPMKLRRRSIDKGLKISSTHEKCSQDHTIESYSCSDLNKSLDVTNLRSVASTRSKYMSSMNEHGAKKGPNNDEYRKHQNPVRYRNASRTESFNSIANTASKGNRKSNNSGSERKHAIAHNEFIYDARPDKALSKGYTTMQMTIGGKQIRLCVPKFSNDDIVERIRAKSASKLADERTRGHAPKQGHKQK